MNIIEDAGIVEAGVFDLKSFTINTKLYCSDPCYNYNKENAHKALPGLYNVRAGLFRADHDVINALYVLQLIEFQKHVRRLMVDKDSALAVNAMNVSSFNWREIEKPVTMEKVKKFVFNTNYADPKYHHTINKIFELADSIIPLMEVELNKFNVNKEQWIVDFLKDSFDYYEFEIASVTEVFGDKQYNEKMEQRLTRACGKVQDYLESTKICRKLFMHIKHESIPKYSPIESDKWEYIDSLHVDSGQLSFMDEEFYKSTGGDDYFERLNNVEKLYTVGINEYGATTNTAYGDGIYPLYAIKDKDDNIVEAIYHFMIEGNEL